MAEASKGKHSKGRKIGRNRVKCAGYRLRETHGNTSKARHIAKVLKAGHKVNGWILTSKGTAMRSAV